MIVVTVTHNPGGTLTVAYGRREIEVSRTRFLSLRQTDPSTYRALKYATGRAVVNPDRVTRLDEGARWDDYLSRQDRPGEQAARPRS